MFQPIRILENQRSMNLRWKFLTGLSFRAHFRRSRFSSFRLFRSATGSSTRGEGSCRKSSGTKAAIPELTGSRGKGSLRIFILSCWIAEGQLAGFVFSIELVLWKPWEQLLWVSNSYKDNEIQVSQNIALNTAKPLYKVVRLGLVEEKYI